MTLSESAREEILGRITRQLRGASGSPPEPAREDLPPVEDTIPEDPAARAARFRQRILEVGATLRSVPDWEAAAAAIDEIVDARSTTRVAVSDHPELDRHLAQVLTGVDIVRAPAPTAELLDCQVGISTAQWAIADTGTLILESAAEAHRLASLVPPIHIAVVPAACILPGIAEALARIAPAAGEAMDRCVTFITGPSRTADIELTLVVGVHGPEELHCILIDGD